MGTRCEESRVIKIRNKNFLLMDNIYFFPSSTIDLMLILMDIMCNPYSMLRLSGKK